MVFEPDNMLVFCYSYLRFLPLFYKLGLEAKMKHAVLQGRLEVICGPMFSGKSDELIRRLTRAEFGKLRTCAFKHKLDDRTSLDYLQAHNGNKLKAFALNSPEEIMLFVTDEIDVIGIDEVQFFPQEIIMVVCSLIDMGKRVIVAGLDLDFRGMPFGPLPSLLALADSVIKLDAVCVQCGRDAHFTQRLINCNPAKFSDPIIMVGAQEHYQARCRNCHTVAL